MVNELQMKPLAPISKGMHAVDLPPIGYVSNQVFVLSQAELRLAARAASAASFLRTLLPAPNLERKMVNELQMKPLAPISKGMQWTFHPLNWIII